MDGVVSLFEASATTIASYFIAESNFVATTAIPIIFPFSFLFIGSWQLNPSSKSNSGLLCSLGAERAHFAIKLFAINTMLIDCD